MSLSERSRSAIYLGLSEVVGDEEAVEEMLSYFPARDVEEPVTKEFLRAELAAFRGEVQVEFGAVRSEIAQLRAELGTELQEGLAGLRAEMLSGDAMLRTELQEGLAGLRAEMHAGFQRQMMWSVTTMVAMCAVLIAAFALLN